MYSVAQNSDLTRRVHGASAEGTAAEKKCDNNNELDSSSPTGLTCRFAASGGLMVVRTGVGDGTNHRWRSTWAETE